MTDPDEFLTDEEKLSVAYGRWYEAVKSVRLRMELDLRTAYELVLAWEWTREAEQLGVVPRAKTTRHA